jgi:hypothetical protein
MGENDIVKVCDFGLSQFQGEGGLRDSSPKGYCQHLRHSRTQSMRW